MQWNLKNTLGLLVLILLYAGFAFFVGSRYHEWILETGIELDAAPKDQIIIGPMTVKSSTCHYLHPNGLWDQVLSGLLCPSCTSEAKRIVQNYTVTVVEKSCHRRGENTLIFGRKS